MAGGGPVGTLTDAEVRAQAARRSWVRGGEVLTWEVTFRDFDEAIRFLEDVGRRAVDYGRRPDAWISSGRVQLSVGNPHHAGFTLAEKRLAEKVGALVREYTA
jgi:pterin-4a-carbinolamine dehydratase